MNPSAADIAGDSDPLGTKVQFTPEGYGLLSRAMSEPVRTIAVVDDEEPVRRAMERLLRSAGFAAETFASGDAFMESLKHRRPDCVILDLHMPGMSGFEVQARLAQMADRPPILILTGHELEDTRMRVASIGGVHAFLRKPVDGQVLLDAIESAVKPYNEN